MQVQMQQVTHEQVCFESGLHKGEIAGLGEADIGEEEGNVEGHSDF